MVVYLKQTWAELEKSRTPVLPKNFRLCLYLSFLHKAKLEILKAKLEIGQT